MRHAAMTEENLSREVYASLSERILNLAYPPGHRLTEEALCAEFEVSRSPVREALGMLVENGLVDKKARHGYTVRRLDLQEIDELYDVRLVLELAVIERVCRTGMDPAELARLEAHWCRLHDQLPHMAGNLAIMDEEFHEVLARHAGNRTLQQMLDHVDKRIHFVRLADITNPDRLRTTCLDHLAILRAVRERDVAMGLAAVRRNIEWGRDNVESALKDALFRAYRCG
jgi:DNA-binding GntR family transcriptional regulator